MSDLTDIITKARRVLMIKKVDATQGALTKLIFIYTLCTFIVYRRYVKKGICKEI